MSSKEEYLSFSVTVLDLLNLWPRMDNYIDNNWRFFKDISLILSLMPCALPILADFILQLYEGAQNLTAITENLIALNCIAGMIYMTYCFIQKRRLIKSLIRNIQTFKRYGNLRDLANTDKKANLYAKVFLFYGIIGNIVYMLMPYINIEACREAKALKKVDDGVPCGVVTRCRMPFKFDYFPVFEIVFLHQFYTCTMVTIVILVLTMLLCGLLMHITNQLRNLRIFIDKLTKSGRHFKYEVQYCIKYHISIIIYSDNTNKVFSDMMVLHLTLTSLVISGLGFMVLIVDNFFDSLRFSLHLLGWLVILLLVCYYGQTLIDESTAIAHDIYSIAWFEASISTQKDIYMILMRAQKPLTLSAANLGVMSLPTFIRVIYSAYSYFTLLLNIKA